MTGSPTAAAAVSPFDAVIFDLDGVVTDTAAVHAAAWKELFDEVLKDPRIPAGANRGPFRIEDYLKYVDGRPREEGVRVFLASRGIVLPDGKASDTAEEWSVFGLGAHKNRLFMERLDREGVLAFPGTVALIQRLRGAGVPVALATASRNAPNVLAAAGLADAFDLVVDGVTANDLNLPGKPEPALFLEAARRLRVPADRAVVIEDAAAGIEAARKGRFGLVVGIDRADRRAELEAAGADYVLNDVSELDLGLVLTHPWRLIYEGFDPAHEGHREALTTLGNGYVAVRGAAPECRMNDVRYPGTYLAGVYNRLVSIIEGQESEDEHMVNVPNWLWQDLHLEGVGWWSEGALKLCRERRVLDLQQATLTREALLEADNGRQLQLRQRRLVSMAQPHLMALESTFTAVGWSGPVRVRSGVDTDVTNENQPEDALLAHRHLVPLPAREAEDAVPVTEVQTSQSNIRIAIATRIRIAGQDSALPGPERGDHFQDFEIPLTDGVPVTVTKAAAIVTSRDRATSSPRSGALLALNQADGDFDEILAEHEAAWHRLLQSFIVEIDSTPQVQLILNLHVFHLLQTLTPHTAELDAGVPARGLHGEGYRGHIFWDELFVLPLITSRMPAIARSLIDYRWRRLESARQAASASGFDGALFPWQSGSDGREETPRWLFNVRSGRWMPDYSHLQRHAGLAVAFNTWQYYLATRDRDWLLHHGAEIIVEVARLVASMAEYDDQTDRFHLRGLMGPDEYHTGYPENPGGGLNDNAYTNVMAAWVCSQAYEIMTVIQGHDLEDLRGRLKIGAAELERWKDVSHRMFVPFLEGGLISQFDGYEDLLELDWERYRNKYRSIERLDLILEAEGDSTNRYRLAKQADALMLLYVLGKEELLSFLGQLGYTVTAEQLDATVDYYLARTAHGSTLSRVAHASVLAGMDPDRAWETFREALDADLDDTQGGTTRSGIHLGAMAGSIDVLQRSFAGLRITKDALLFAPKLPKVLGRVFFRIRYREQLLDVHLEHGRLGVTAASGDAAPVLVRVGSEEAMIAAGEHRQFQLP